MNIKDLLALMREKAEHLSHIADFMDAYHQAELSAWFRYAQSCVLWIMDIIEDNKYKKLDDVEELLAEMNEESGDNVFRFKNTSFLKFAELAIIEQDIINSIRADIERNK